MQCAGVGCAREVKLIITAGAVSRSAQYMMKHVTSQTPWNMHTVNMSKDWIPYFIQNELLRFNFDKVKRNVNIQL